MLRLKGAITLCNYLRNKKWPDLCGHNTHQCCMHQTGEQTIYSDKYWASWRNIEHVFVKILHCTSLTQVPNFDSSNTPVLRHNTEAGGSIIGLEQYQKSYPIPNTIGSCRYQYPIPIPIPVPCSLPSEALYWFNVLIFLQTLAYVNAMASKVWCIKQCF